MTKRAPADGKQLEELVATIEGLLVPQGFTVAKRERVYEDGVQVAELDITIRGKVGSANITWLIECRDRPSEGPAPVAWIEQLVGRRSHHKFDKVTAVSTTGFAAGAIKHANEVGIDLRAVDEVAPEMVAWLAMGSMQTRETRHFLHHANFVIDKDETPERFQAAQAVIRKEAEKPLEATILRSTQTGQKGTAVQAFVNIVGQNPSLLADVVPNQEPKPIRLVVEYPLESHFVIDTDLGPVRVARIEFDGALAITEADVPLEHLSEYRQVGAAQPISQTSGFILPLPEGKIALELHRLGQSGDTVMTIRPLVPPNAEPDQVK